MHHYDDEIDLGEFVRELWRAKALILTVGLLCAVAAFAFMLLRGRQAVFEATAELVPRRIRMDAADAQQDQAVRLNSYRAGFDRAVQRWGVTNACAAIPGATGSVPAAAVSATARTNGITVSVRLPNAALAASVANACADALVALVDKMLTDDVAVTATQRDVAMSRLTEAGQRLEAARQAQADGKNVSPAALVELDRLEVEYSVARKLYADAAMNAQTSQLFTTAPAVHLQRAVPARPSTQPVPGRSPWLVAAVAGLTGIVLAAFLLLVSDALSALANRSRPEPPAAI
jgi:LPS O-antigen subunit length determinant protein (WzzB/FepE family)